MPEFQIIWFTTTDENGRYTIQCNETFYVPDCWGTNRISQNVYKSKKPLNQNSELEDAALNEVVIMKTKA
jgi:hypothetical protein